MILWPTGAARACSGKSVHKKGEHISCVPYLLENWILILYLGRVSRPSRLLFAFHTLQGVWRVSATLFMFESLARASFCHA